MRQSIFDVVRREHRAVAGLLDELAATREGDERQRRELFGALSEIVDLHVAAIEAILHPTLRHDRAAQVLADEGRTEHRSILALVACMTAADPGSTTWTAQLAVLDEQLSHHFEIEEASVFEAARRILSAADAERLGREFELARRTRDGERHQVDQAG